MNETSDAAVRVMDCTGSAAVSTVVGGIEWVVANAIYPAVALMSLGTSASAVLDAAVSTMTAANITVVVAAGNNDEGQPTAMASHWLGEWSPPHIALSSSI